MVALDRSLLLAWLTAARRCTCRTRPRHLQEHAPWPAASFCARGPAGRPRKSPERAAARNNPDPRRGKKAAKPKRRVEPRVRAYPAGLASGRSPTRADAAASFAFPCRRGIGPVRSIPSSSSSQWQRSLGANGRKRPARKPTRDTRSTITTTQGLDAYVRAPGPGTQRFACVSVR